jgi:hypothetical protein
LNQIRKTFGRRQTFQGRLYKPDKHCETHY